MSWLQLLGGHSTAVVAVAFSADGSRILSSGDKADPSLCIWAWEQAAEVGAC